MGNMQEMSSMANIVQWNQISETDGITHIDRLYQRFQGIYMQKWASQFTSDAMLANWRETWSEGLAGITADQVRRGLNGCANLDWPPSLPEFLRLCVGSEHQLNYEIMFHEAAKLAAQQAHGAKVQWPSALLYWSAEAFGCDEIRFATWMNCQKRWTETVDEMRREEILPPIPAHEALPAPGKTAMTADVVHQRVQELAAAKMANARSDEKNEWGISPRHHLMTVHTFPKFDPLIAIGAMRRLHWAEGKIQRFMIEVWEMTDAEKIARLLGLALQ